jgi:hypothetical protein
MITATNSGTKRELIPAGSYISRCYSMIHIGTNTENILGVEKRMNRVRITWELPNELRDFDGTMKPLVISKEYTLSMHEKANLRKDLENWRGKGFSEDEAKSFEITKLLGVPCLLSIIHEKTTQGSEYAKIGGISGLVKGMICEKQFNTTFEFNFTDHFDAEKLESFPDFIKDKIKSSEEYINLILGKVDPSQDIPQNDEFNGEKIDDLPF